MRKPYSNLDSPGLTQIGSPMWQAEADTELTLSALLATAVCQLTLTLVNWRYSTVSNLALLWF